MTLRKNERATGYGIMLFAASAFSFLLWILGAAFQYCLYGIFGLSAPWWADLIGGFIANAFVLSLAVLLWIAEVCGAAFPLFTGAW